MASEGRGARESPARPFPLTRFEVRRRARGIAAASGFLVVLSGLVIGIYPSVKDTDVYGDFIDNLSPEMREAFTGGLTSIDSIEAFLTIELYRTMWLLILGIYVAYYAASTVAGDVQDGSIEATLMAPITRTRYVLSRFGTVLAAIVAICATTYVANYLLVGAIGEQVDAADLGLLHALFVVYLAACGALGLVASVTITGNERRAQVAAIGAVFAMYLVDSVTVDSDYEWLGNLTFVEYFEPAEILVLQDPDWAGIAVLFAAAVGLVMLAAELFERRDVSL